MTPRAENLHALVRLGFDLWSLKEACQRGAGVLDDKAFLGWSGFTLTFFGGFFVRHEIVSIGPLIGEVPQPGIGPGRHEWARDCKSRLSASSSTGAQAVLNVGAGMPVKTSPVPTWFGPLSAALNPSSYHASYSRKGIIYMTTAGSPRSLAIR